MKVSEKITLFLEKRVNQRILVDLKETGLEGIDL
jgi:hypothetical protein